MTHHPRACHPDRDDGSATAEFAVGLLAVSTLLTFCGVVGNVMTTSVNLQGAVISAAQLAARGVPGATVKNSVTHQVPNAQVSVTTSKTTAQVSATCAIPLPLIGHITIARQASAAVQQ